MSVDDEAHRLARIRDAETGNTLSAMMWDMLLAMLRIPAESGPTDTEPERRAQLLDEVFEKPRTEGIGVDTSRLLIGEES